MPVDCELPRLERSCSAGGRISNLQGPLTVGILSQVPRGSESEVTRERIEDSSFPISFEFSQLSPNIWMHET